MIASLEKVDAIHLSQVHATVFLGDTPRPHVRAQVFQRFGFPNAAKGFLEDRLHQIQQTFGGAPVGLDPVAQIRSELGLEDGQPLWLSLQVSSSFNCAANSATVAGVPALARARANAGSKRWAFAGERSRWAVSINDSSSSAASIAHADNDHFAVIDSAVHQRFELFSGLAVGGFNSHG